MGFIRFCIYIWAFSGLISLVIIGALSMIYLLAVICVVISLEVGLRIGRNNYVSRKEIDQIRAMRGF